jgi:4-hydroxybenzoate polyprenyltransferase
MPRLSDILRLIRPHQHVKNAFVLLPLFFAGEFMNPSLLTKAFVAFVAFSAVASAVYALNDLLDVEEDRAHPKKQVRPIAAGTIAIPFARGLCICLASAGLLLSITLSVHTALYLLAYLILNIGYSVTLKRISLLDVTIIAIGFALRLFMGASATETPLSMWIVMMTFLLALFLALAKRRDDLVIHAQTGEKMRVASKGYNLEMINSSMTLVGSVVVVTYIQYTLSPEVRSRLGTDTLYLTTFFVVMGILRYLQITFVLQDSGSPTQVLLRDRFTQITLLLWMITFGWILYT